jgi:NACHT domain
MPSFLRSFFSKLTGAHRLLAFILTATLSTILLAFLAGGWRTGIPIGILVLAVLWLTGPLWKPLEPSKTRIALSSLSVISAVALAVAGKTPEAKPWLTNVITHLGFSGETAEKVLPLDHVTSAFVLAFVLTAVFAINWLARDRSAMQKHPKPIDEDFPEQTYREQLRRYSQVLAGRLATLDDETKWDDYFFAPLEAEVEVNSGRQTRKKIVDLMKALKGERTSRIILVLGDPGSGKSIALRKLAKDLLAEVEKTGRLPVYVNLKEWAHGKQWTEQEPPTKEDLRDFILHSLKAQSLFADQFLGTYFNPMLDRGRFFFLLDSFDEIPAVLDVAEASWLVQYLSKLISEFFVGQDQGRGILASRFYRRPKLNREESATFEIRPFSDLRIHEALMRSGKLRQETVDQLFTTRTELIPVARNPFSAALIRLYAESHGGALPANQLDMFESYIQNRLAGSSGEASRHGLNEEKLIKGATDIAWSMFQAAEIGLEAPISRLAELLPDAQVEPITAVLRYSGLARLSSVPDRRFSFVHRRLNEYFVARRLLDDPASVSLQTIPTDSRYRDALALYCEVGDAKHVSAIADFCWNEIASVQTGDAGTTTTPEQLRAAHCLRFLRDAFRTRPDSLAFLPHLADYIAEKIQPRGDLLAAKLALEATGLLPEPLAEPILVQALEMDNQWLGETALRACRHQKRIGKELEGRLQEYLQGIAVQDFLRRYKEITFSLSLSDAFLRLRRYCALRSADNRILVVTAGFCAAMSPTLVAVAGIPYFLLSPLTGSPRTMHRLWTRRNVYLLARLQIGATLVIAAVSRLFPQAHHVVGWRRLLNPIEMVHGSALIYVIGIYVIIGLAIAPLLDISLVLQRFRWRSIDPAPLGITVAFMAFIGGVVYLASKLALRFQKYATYALTLIFGAFGSYLLLKALPLLLQIRGDREHLRKSQQAAAISRASIAGDFGQFQTTWYRTKYVLWLRDSQAQPIGPWPNGRPNTGDDASTLLAQLDERWLGLEG